MKKKQPKHVESEISREEAEWMDAVNDTTARLMVEWLKAGTDVRKPIDSLNKAQLSALAEIARSTYIVERSKRRAEQPTRETEILGLWGLWA